MANSVKQPRLRVISGAKAASDHVAGEMHEALSARAHLHVLSPLQPVAAQQLSLPWLNPTKRTIISLGLKGAVKADLVQVIRRYGIRRVADIRVSPSFRGRDFDLATITSLFHMNGITYQRFSSLANRFVGESLNPHVVLDMYERYVTNQEAALREFCEAVDAGPLLLLGWDENHSPSERSILIDAVARLGHTFELVVASLERGPR
ncbi:DUF488 family protein [Chondromyces apiculatus]|uniref:DUF488 family protein n=1 Tax=Chondromyces apiculatus TaxID=51 RepID=UPI0012DF9C33|nr:DUF488 family protein [Chondromyces apiculatus]